MRRTVALLAVTAALLLPACGDDNTSGLGTTSPTTTNTEPAATTTTQPEPSTTPASWPTAEVTVPFTGSVPPVPTLVDIRVGAHPEGGYDRAAFEFEGLPGYSVRYESEIAYDGSGEPVDLEGDAFIQLVFNPAQAHDDQGGSTLQTAPVTPVDVGFPSLRSYVMNGDFEGYVSVALGLTDKVGFNVDQLRQDNGNYVVYIDVAQP